MKSRGLFLARLPGLLAAVAAISAHILFAEVVIYPAPNGAPPSTRYSVKVNGQPVFVYNAKIPDPLNASFASFDIDKPVTVSITANSGLNAVTLRPRNIKFDPSTSGNTITIQVAKPGKIALTTDNNSSNPLFLFVNPLEVNPPQQGSPGVTYFGPGIHDIGTLTIGSNQTVYIAGGAIVRGGMLQISTSSTGASIRGRGIMDRTGAKDVAIWAGGKKTSIEGIIIANQPSMMGHVVLGGCDGLSVENLNLVSGDNWSNDGIYMIGCSNATINNCFVKNFDDGVTIKSYGDFSGNVNNITVSNCMFWTHWAHSVVIGAEANTSIFSNITFKNIDAVLLAKEMDYNNYTGAMGIYNSDNADISGVRFEDFRVDVYSANRRVINLSINNSTWSTSQTRGQIHDVYFKNISVTDDGGHGWENYISGFDNTHLISNVTFENLDFRGTPIIGVNEGNFTVKNAKNLVFLTSTTRARRPVAPIVKSAVMGSPHFKAVNLRGEVLKNGSCGSSGEAPCLLRLRPKN